MPNPLEALDEALRILKKGGFISLIDHSARGRAVATARPVLGAVDAGGAMLPDSAKQAGDSFRESILDHLAARRDIHVDTERALPRLFMLRAQKI